MKTSLTLKMTMIIGMLCLNATAFAQMSGNYEIVKTDCSHFMLSQFKTAVVKATASKFQVGVLSNYGSPDGSMVFRPVFDYKVGAKKVNCLTDACYTVYVGAYSADLNQFEEATYHGLDQATEATLKSAVTFSLNGDELKIEKDNQECLLKKID